MDLGSSCVLRVVVTHVGYAIQGHGEQQAVTNPRNSLLVTARVSRCLHRSPCPAQILRGVAQSGRALALGVSGCAFNSRLLDK